MTEIVVTEAFMDYVSALEHLVLSFIDEDDQTPVVRLVRDSRRPPED